MLSDVEIAQNAKVDKISVAAGKLGLSEDDLEFYGKFKAKISRDVWRDFFLRCDVTVDCFDRANVPRL